MSSQVAHIKNFPGGVYRVINYGVIGNWASTPINIVFIDQESILNKLTEDIDLKPLELGTDEGRLLLLYSVFRLIGGKSIFLSLLFPINKAFQSIRITY
jgi:hypothetical protein